MVYCLTTACRNDSGFWPSGICLWNVTDSHGFLVPNNNAINTINEACIYFTVMKNNFELAKCDAVT